MSIRAGCLSVLNGFECLGTRKRIWSCSVHILLLQKQKTFFKMDSQNARTILETDFSLLKQSVITYHDVAKTVASLRFDWKSGTAVSPFSKYLFTKTTFVPFFLKLFNLSLLFLLSIQVDTESALFAISNFIKWLWYEFRFHDWS